MDTNQLGLTKSADWHHVTGRFKDNYKGVLERNVSPKFAMMEKVVLNVNSTHSTVK